MQTLRKVVTLNNKQITRAAVRLPLLILAAINLVGTFYVGNNYDFNTFVRAGQAVVSGGNPYAFPERLSTNLNPPLTLFAFQLLAKSDPITVFQAWRIISFGLYILILAFLAKTYHTPGAPTKVAWALAMTGIWYTLLLGQLYVFLLGLCAGAWFLLRAEKGIYAGLLIGLLAAIKPNFLIWPGLLLLSGAWIPALTAWGVTALLSALPLIVYGPQVYQQWIEMLLVYKAAPLATNMSLIGLASRLGVPAAGLALSLGLLATVAWVAWRKKPPLLETSGISILAALLATAFSWVGYSILLLPVFFSQRWSWRMVAAAILLCVPSIIIFYLGRLTPLAQFAGGLVYFVPLVLVLIDLLLQIYKSKDSSNALSEKSANQRIQQVIEAPG
jgi:hypothetical protein